MTETQELRWEVIEEVAFELHHEGREGWQQKTVEKGIRRIKSDNF